MNPSSSVPLQHALFENTHSRPQASEIGGLTRGSER